MDHIPPFGGAPTDNYVDRNLGTGTPGSKVPARFFNELPAEILNVITGAGLTPDENDLTQLFQAIGILAAGGDMFKADNLSGLADVITARANLGVLQRRGTDIATDPSGTTDIGSADSHYVRLTGTNGITSLGTGIARDFVMVEFSGETIITHHATNLILPGLANITTAAGDRAIFVRRGAEGSAQWMCISYVRSNGSGVKETSSLAGNGYQRLSSGLVLQWGYHANATAGATTVTFPIAFPSALWAFTSCPIVSSPTGADCITAAVSNNSSITVNRKANSSNSAVSFFWIALGV